ncbi:MAG: hypothetical protein G01um101438_866 [Parcubacteria group bacterium Gr01-1014_38]|nr:MAG: hypothetical protein G01um101438_866 [Parcubacteria group bacterium Gr01-1014_38]
MAKKIFGLKQIRQLEEIQKTRLKKEGTGIHEEVQELIQRLTAGGVGTPDTADPFLIQTKVLWDFGWGRELGVTTIDAYRKSVEKEGLATKPDRPAGMPEHLNRLVLWDRRPLLEKRERREQVSLVKICRLLNVDFSGDDETFIQHEATPEITVPVRWVWCQDGRRNRNRSPKDCRTSFHAPEVGIEALGGLFLFAQDRSVIGGTRGAWHVVDLPGSVHRDCPSRCACLLLWSGWPRLRWGWDDDADPGCGSASRWE